ncbi:XRN 5'-3' exonuclease [Yasminevirus sp. GU-2018]|uniref:XRN 5'-3' exonuclease n=1 Tax=Yasminevirus sp. GU-2018 TaxID=2420051 RepID=A0A5K0UAG7_9VIRU|nr:XRN 5'-3' exonuclease [Yasminevirus sp. GU-2018]
MGIDNFFKSLAKSKIGRDTNSIESSRQNTSTYGDSSRDVQSDIQHGTVSTKTYAIDQIGSKLRIGCKRFYIDFNSILHEVSNRIEQDVRYVQYAMIIDKIDEKCHTFMKSLDPNYKFPHDSFSMEQKCADFKKLMYRLINDTYVLNRVRDYVDNIMTDLITGDTVERLYISMDGMPTMAKIVEQRKRRVMTSIIGGIRRKMHSNLKSHLSYERSLYETYIYTFDRTKLAPASEFMEVLYVYMTGSSELLFQAYMKSKYPCLKTIVVSSHHQPGEGEKKIMEDIISTNNKLDECIIFSPDSDVIILSVLIRNMLNRRATLEMEEESKDDSKNDSKGDSQEDSTDDTRSEQRQDIRPESASGNGLKVTVNDSKKKQKIFSPKTKNVSKVGMIRLNSYDGSYEYISADDLCHEIFTYIQKRTKLTLDEDRVTNDISFVFTLLGNDFLPRLESVNIKNDIEIVLNVYAQMLEITHRSRHFGMYIIYHNRKKYRVNYASFSKYIELLSQMEVALMKDKYMSSTYRNYKRLKSIFSESTEDTKTKDFSNESLTDGSDNLSDSNVEPLYPQLIQYLQFANIIFSTKKKMTEISMRSEVKKTVTSSHAYSRNKYGSTAGYRTDSRTDKRVDIMSYVQAELSSVFQHLDPVQFGETLNKMIKIFLKVERIRVNMTNWSSIHALDKLTRLVQEVINDGYVGPSLELKYDEQNVRTPYHQQNIKSKFPHPDMEITVYDEEYYMITRCMGRYRDALEPEYEIGSFRLSINHGRYRYDSSYIVDDAREYYDRYFSERRLDEKPQEKPQEKPLEKPIINRSLSKDGESNGAVRSVDSFETSTVFSGSIKRPDSERSIVDDSQTLDTIVSEYIRGLFWVFNYYVNCNDVEFNRTMASTWFYKYSHAPFLFHISKYIHNMTKTTKDRKDRWNWMEELYESVSEENYVPRRHFMSNIEYYVYVNPYHKLDESILGSKLYRELIKVEHTELFCDIDDVIERLWDGDKNIIDTRNTYLSRGKLIGFKPLSYKEWRSVLAKNGVDLEIFNECCDSVISVDRALDLVDMSFDTKTDDSSVDTTDSCESLAQIKLKPDTNCIVYQPSKEVTMIPEYTLWADHPFVAVIRGVN